VRKLDAYRIISTGNSTPRASAWHQRQEGSWKEDTPEQAQRMLAEQNPDPVSVLSVHAYKERKDLIPQLVKLARRIRKPLFIGEFGVRGPEAEKEFGQFVQIIEKAGVPMAAVWVYDRGAEDPFTITGSNDRAYQLKALGEANKRLGVNKRKVGD